MFIKQQRLTQYNIFIQWSVWFVVLGIKSRTSCMISIHSNCWHKSQPNMYLSKIYTVNFNKKMNHYNKQCWNDWIYVYTTSINEFQMHHIKWMKAYSRVYILHDCIYNILEMENWLEIKWDSSCKKTDMWKRINNWWQVLLRTDKTVVNLNYSSSYIVVYICQNSSKDVMKEQVFKLFY